MSERWQFVATCGSLGSLTGLAVSAFVGNPLTWMGMGFLMGVGFALPAGKIE